MADLHSLARSKKARNTGYMRTRSGRRSQAHTRQLVANGNRDSGHRSQCRSVKPYDPAADYIGKRIINCVSTIPKTSPSGLHAESSRPIPRPVPTASPYVTQPNRFASSCRGLQRFPVISTIAATAVDRIRANANSPARASFIRRKQPQRRQSRAEQPNQRELESSRFRSDSGISFSGWRSSRKPLPKRCPVWWPWACSISLPFMLPSAHDPSNHQAIGHRACTLPTSCPSSA